jgi:FKBP-type peptidyl-prolyl cis-trans isomerase
MMRFSWLVIILIAGTLGSCLNNTAVTDTSASQYSKDTTAISLYLLQNRIGATKLPQGIWFIVDSLTNGIHANFSDSIELKYTSRLLADNSIVNQSTTPRHFVLDSLQEGVKEVLPLFPAGSKGRMFIPSYYTGSSNWIFQFQLTDVKDHQLSLDIVTIDNYLSQHSITAVKDGSGLRYTVDSLKLGASPGLSDDIQINYTAKNLADGSVVDQGSAVTFPLSGLILGLQIGIQKINEGSTCTFYLPSSLGYGPRSAGKTIKANENLIFNIKLLKIIHH